MTDNLIFGGPGLLPDVDITTSGSGFEVDQSVDGSGSGPTGAERTIEAIFLDYSSPATGVDLWTSYHQNGAMFYDSDQNGYFDVLQRADDYGVWNYNADTGAWTYREFVENKDADNKEK